MFQSFTHQHDEQYPASYYYTEMNESRKNCSPEFRVRSQTWGGNEVGYRSRVVQGGGQGPVEDEDHSPIHQYACYDSMNSIEDSVNESNHENNESTKVDSLLKETNVKKTSRKNPWGQETYADLIERAINSYPIKMATLQQIYDHIAKNYKYFMDRSDAASSAGWKNSIRHNLSLHDKFLKCPKKNENMKSSLWTINQNCFKRMRSNSMDCKKGAHLEMMSKRRQLKDHRRSSTAATSNCNVASDSKRLLALRSPKIEKTVQSEHSTIHSISMEESLMEKSPEYLDMDVKYMPPEIPSSVTCGPHPDKLHEDLQRLGMNHMEPIYNYDDESFNYDSSHLPNFQIAAMEYSKFVAEIFIEDLE